MYVVRISHSLKDHSPTHTQTPTGKTHGSLLSVFEKLEKSLESSHTVKNHQISCEWKSGSSWISRQQVDTTSSGITHGKDKNSSDLHESHTFSPLRGETKSTPVCTESQDCQDMCRGERNFGRCCHVETSSKRFEKGTNRA